MTAWCRANPPVAPLTGMVALVAHPRGVCIVHPQGRLFWLKQAVSARSVLFERGVEWCWWLSWCRLGDGTVAAS